MKTTNQVKPVEETKVDNLELHRRMYERRLRLLKEREGLTEGDATDRANDPSLFDIDTTERTSDE